MRVGGFELLQRLGKGGMGQVWRCRHINSGREAVLKTILGARASDERFIEAFYREVEAIASLDHPGVVAVYDFGQIKEGGELSEAFGVGQPYLIMERLRGPSLGDLRDQLSFLELRELLDSLLQTLAFVHARGIVHRDLKPGNVLLSRPGVWKSATLIDFGIASLGMLGSETGSKGIGGTPGYMAPEQIDRARSGEQGPWTDLYALGCLIYELITGRPPFESPIARETMRRHLEEPMPPLPTSMDLPRRFESWLARLLCKDPADRYRFAADALEGLRWLGQTNSSGLPSLGTSDRPAVPASSAMLQPHTKRVTGSLFGDESVFGDDSLLGGSLFGDSLINDLRLSSPISTLDLPQTDTGHNSSTVTPIELLRPSLARSWRELWVERHFRPALLDVGLGLFGLRRIPLIGREEERDRIWSLLRGVEQAQQPALCTLQGASGVGKSSLARWLCHQAHEVGAAQVVHARAIEGEEPNRGKVFEQLLARPIGLSPGMSSEDRRACMESWLHREGIVDPFVRGSLETLLFEDEATFEEAQYKQMLLVVANLLGRLALDRALVVWMDDLRHDPSAIQLASTLLELGTQESLPILVLLSVRAEAVEALDDLSQPLEALLEREDCSLLRVDPLDDHEMARLLRELFQLDLRQSSRIQALSAGNPSFVVQLLTHWVDQGLLSPAPESGMRVAPRAFKLLPKEQSALWAQRLETLLDGQPEQFDTALRLAALLGHQVDAQEWERACARLGIEPPHLQIEKMTRQRLAERASGHSWRWGHAMFRAVVLDRTREEPARSAELHSAIADVLEELYGELPAQQARRGEHLLAAGRREEAIGPLLRGADYANHHQRDMRSTAPLLRRARAQLERLDPPASDPRWCELRYMEVNQLQDFGKHKQCNQMLESLLADARRYGWEEHLPAIQTRLADNLDWLGENKQAHAMYLDLYHDYERRGETLKMGATCPGIAWTLVSMGEIDRAEEYYLRGIELVADYVDEVEGFVAMNNLHTRYAGLLYQRGDLEGAMQQIDAVVQLFGEESYCSRADEIAYALLYRAEIRRQRGENLEALRDYEEALQIMEALGFGQAFYARLGLAFCKVAQRQWGQARVVLLDLVPTLEEQGQTPYLRIAEATLMTCAAGEGDWASWRRYQARVEEFFASKSFVDLDAALMLKTAGEEAIKGARPDLAQIAYRLALPLFEALKREEHINACKQALASLTPHPSHEPAELEHLPN